MDVSRRGAIARGRGDRRCFGTRASQIAAIVLVATIVMVSGCRGGGNPASEAVAAAEVPTEHADGKRLFDTYCARCHGVHAAGTGRGPSFLSKIYEPSHHGDEAFVLAAKRGVSAHHWGFGNMPPIPGISDDDVTKIIGYVRWAQRVAGIA